ncbi:MAG: FAD-dependent oxidoreductase, partial [Desulfobacteraceae bacterium]|nr:FAD-dependent oxidoreductase [Desulfobacteraceae bacterium]
EPVEGSETLIDVDTIITAIGQSPEALPKEDGSHARMTELELTRWNTIENDPEVLTTTIPYVFTGGDAATGPSLVVEAIGGGRRAARSIDMFLKGEKVTPVPESLRQKRIRESIFTEVKGIAKSKRAKLPELPVKDRLDSYVEVDLVLPEEEAHKEACRCLDCCRLCYNPDKLVPFT